MSRAELAVSTTRAANAAAACLYRVEQDAVIRLDTDDERALDSLFASVKQRLGRNIRVSCWPYRHGRHWCVALDLEGDAGEVNINLFEGDRPCLPGIRDCDWALTADDWRVCDIIDAFYLVCALLSALDAMPGAGDWPFLGLKRITR